MADIIEQSFEILVEGDDRIRGDVRWRARGNYRCDTRFPILIVCHGFKAFKDWGPFPAIGRYLAQENFVSVVFNFSHNGVGEHPKKFTEFEKFANNTVSLELRDLEALISFICEDSFFQNIGDASRLGIIGHSRGGALALITAKEDRRIKAVTSWSSIARFDRYTEEQKHRWREKGFVQLHSASTVKHLTITTALLDDLERNIRRFDIVKAVADLRKPLLIIHGSADVPVKAEEAELLYSAADKNSTEYILLDGVGHIYGAKHPFREMSPSLLQVLELTTRWFHKHL